MKKRIVAIITLLVLVLSLSVTAFADTKPTAKLLKESLNQTVARGKTITFVWKLNSGSYTKVGKVFKAKMDTVITKKVDGEKTSFGAATWQFTGTQKYSLTAKIQKNAPTGKYTLNYTTYYRKTIKSAWKKANAYKAKFTVK